MLDAPRTAPLTKRSLLALLVIAGCAHGISNQSTSVVSSSSVWLRNTYDTDPSIYVGRFVAPDVTDLDESNTMALACSKHITTRFVEGGDVEYTEDLHVNNQVALKIGMPAIASGSAGYSHQRTAQVRYTLTGKLVAEISDPEAFAACCKSQPDQCTDRFIGEFIQGTGAVYHSAARDMSLEGEGTDPTNGLSGEGGASRSVEYQRAAEFPNPVYFAFKVNPTPYSQGLVDTCPAWVNDPPEVDGGVYVVGSADQSRSERAARDAALRSASATAMRSVGVFVPVRAEEWCITSAKKGKRTRFSARVLGFVSDATVAEAREQARLEAEREAAAEAAKAQGGAQGGPAPAEPAGDAREATPPAEARDVTRVLAAVRAETASSDKLSALELAVRGARLSAAEARQVLDEFSMSADKLEALKVLAGQVEDPKNWQVLVDAFSFSGDREAARKLAPAP